MPKTYDKPEQETIDMLDEVLELFHPRLKTADVKIGIIMAFGPRDEDGNLTDYAITGYGGAQAGACVKIVNLKDRLVKGYDVEMLIDGDCWPTMPIETQRAMLDHECTHIELKGDNDDLGRPKLKIRDEDFIVWGFKEVVQRHGSHAIEHRTLKKLIDEDGHLLLDLEGAAPALKD